MLRGKRYRVVIGGLGKGGELCQLWHIFSRIAGLGRFAVTVRRVVGWAGRGVVLGGLSFHEWDRDVVVSWGCS